jgi:meso-butanediol dehydrogenase / (S,S)-butanediol dehydrogenase / diacetyl reductase
VNGRFIGKIAIVTGGSSGIGAAIVRRLSSEGARVMIADLSPPEVESDTVLFHRCDLTSSAEVTAMVKATADRFGGLDILVNNAGIGCLAETPDLPEETWEKLFAINVSAVFYACKVAVPLMRTGGGGAIVNVASISGLGGDYGFTAYNASKGAVINYTRSLALDGARDGIRVNALCPGAIGQTAMGVGTHGSDADKQAWLDAIPLGRTGTPDEMANVVAFLASDEASFMTGSIVVADGGATAHTGQPNVVAQVRRRQAAQGN